MKIGRSAMALSLMAFLLAGCGGGTGGEATEASSHGGKLQRPAPKKRRFDLTLEGYPDAENVGVLMADRHGYFAEAGLDVLVLHPVDSNNVPAYVAEGVDLFGLLPQPQIGMARKEEMPLVAVGGLVKRPTMALVWPRRSKIHGPADLKGKTIAINGFSFEEGFVEALLAQEGLKPGDVEVKSVSYGLVPALVKGRADAILGSANVEGIELEARGLKPVVVPLQKLGIPAYEELVIATRRRQLAGNPPWIGRFLSAVARGTVAAIEDPEAAAAAILAARKELELPPAPLKVTLAKVKATLPLLARRPRMSPKEAARLSEWMHEEGLIRKKPPAAALLTNRYVQPRS